MTTKNEMVEYYRYDPDNDTLIHAPLSGIDFAKLMIYNHGKNALLWREHEPEVTSIMGEKLKSRIDSAVHKHLNRTKNFLGIE